jgi:hypothetical protein
LSNCSRSPCRSRFVVDARGVGTRCGSFGCVSMEDVKGGVRASGYGLKKAIRLCSGVVIVVFLLSSDETGERPQATSMGGPAEEDSLESILLWIL